jgi:DNA-binding transcriptional LysR family regulator
MMRPELRELECFLAVAEELSFSRAARRLNLSQPPLTRHVQSLEEKLDARLFDRDTHSVRLTRSGSLYLEDARQILAQMDRAAESVRRTHAGQTNRLRLAFVGALLDERLIQLTQRFRLANPQCQLEIFDLPPAGQLQGIESGELDGGFVGARPPRLAKGLEALRYAKEPLILALPQGHPLARRHKLAWRNLRGLPWVLISANAAPAFRRQFSEINARFALEARVIQESERLPAVLTMVGAGMGVTLVPLSTQNLAHGCVAFQPLPKPSPLLHLAFVFARENRNPCLPGFLASLKSFATD